MSTTGLGIARCPARCLLRPTKLPALFTPGSRTTLRTLPPLTPSEREYTPARSADRHRPEAHCPHSCPHRCRFWTRVTQAKNGVRRHGYSHRRPRMAGRAETGRMTWGTAAHTARSG
jgi:hypothetical protein